MKIELTEEEVKLLLESCVEAQKAQSRTDDAIVYMHLSTAIDKMESIINKLSEKKCENLD